MDTSVAVLLQAHEAEWDTTKRLLGLAPALYPGWLHLKSGIAQLEFYSGATVILQGPADLMLISHRGDCSRGRLRATVPPQAQGFTIGSPKLDLVDRGTEFGLRVTEGEQTEVHVFKGKVELYDDPPKPASRPMELTTGKSVRVDKPGGISPIPTDPAAFEIRRGSRSPGEG